MKMFNKINYSKDSARINVSAIYFQMSEQDSLACMTRSITRDKIHIGSAGHHIYEDIAGKTYAVYDRQSYRCNSLTATRYILFLIYRLCMVGRTMAARPINVDYASSAKHLAMANAAD